jgi:hypothetical protein
MGSLAIVSGVRGVFLDPEHRGVYLFGSWAVACLFVSALAWTFSTRPGLWRWLTYAFAGATIPVCFRLAYFLVSGR